MASCAGEEGVETGPSVPVEVLETLPAVPEATPAIDPRVAENLLTLAGKLGELDFPSTSDVIERCRGGEPAACSSLGTRLAAGTWGLDKDESEAVPLFRFACDAGELEGCHSLGLALKYGRGVEADPPASVELFSRACDGEHLVACSFLSDAYLYGHGVDADGDRALAITERSCLLGSFCYRVPVQRLGQLSGQPGARFASTEDAAETACAAGDSQGCWWQALQLASAGDDDTRYARVESLLDGACSGGVGGACDSLGFHYLRRHTSPGYAAKAHGAFRRACDHDVGCDHLEACPEGDSTHVQALAGETLAAEEDCRQGRMDRCLSFGIRLKTGNGVTRDQARAATLFERVCDSGDPYGCWYLGGMLARGEGIPEDDDRAAALFRRCCDADHPNGCVDLAFAHVHGRGVPQDLATAVSLFDKACTLGTACAHADHYRAQLE